MSQNIRFFLFSTIFMINCISGVATSTLVTIKDHIQAVNKTKLGIKALGTAASYWSMYKMLQVIDNSLKDRVKVVQGKGVVIDLSFVPAAIAAVSSAIVGTKLLVSSCQQIFDDQVHTSHKKPQKMQLLIDQTCNKSSTQNKNIGRHFYSFQ